MSGALLASSGTRAKLTELQEILLRTACKHGSVRTSLSSRRRRNAAQRLKRLGLVVWSDRLHAWTPTDSGRAKVARVGGKVRDVTPNLDFSNYLRQN